MRRLLTLLTVAMLSIGVVTAQTRTVTGTVTAKEGGLPVAGATITVKGKSMGTQVGADGKYTIQLPSGASVLVFSAVGSVAQELTVPATNRLNVALAASTQQLNEVVVVAGAFGTTRTAKSTTYNAQVVDSKQLTTIRETNLNNALAGKVAGLQVRSQSAAALGRETEVRLRGASGFDFGSGALYIVNGTILPNSDDVNVDDIENVTVLQGTAAAAQFGAQAANGAIVITLKSGKKSTGLGVIANLGATVENTYILPNYQNSYAGGASADLMKYTWKTGDPDAWKALDGKFYHDYSDDASWGPRMVGQEHIPWYAWYGGTKYSYKTTSLTPQPNNSRDFYNTGVTLNNSISLSSASDNSTMKFTFGNQDTKGLLPGTSLKKNTFNLITTYKLNSHLEVAANVNYVTRMLNGEIDDDYSNQSSGSFNQWFHRDLDMGIMKELRGLTTPDGIYASWNHANPNSFDPANTRNFYAGNYWYNHYTWFDMIKKQNQRDRLFGNVSLTYKINKDLKVSATYRKQQATTFGETKYSSRLSESGLQTSGNSPEAKGFYATSNTFSNRQNLEFLVTYTKKIKDFSVEANVGSDFFSSVYKDNGASTNNGLNIPDLFTVTNSKDQASTYNNRIQEKYNAILGKATIGYKGFAYLDATLRNDWYSTLPANNNSVLSKSIGASLVFSDLIKNSIPWLSYGKIRASWGEVPKALGTDNTSFGAYRYPGFAYGVGEFKWGSSFLMGTPDQLVDPNIHGSVVTQSEIGLDLSFLNNKIGLSATYWMGKESDFPYALTVNGASGYTSFLTNIGEISKKGVELQLNARPITMRNFNWRVNGTWSPLIQNDVVKLSPQAGITQTNALGGVYGSTTGMPYMVHTEGKRWGQLFGNGMKRINGVPVLDSKGFYVNDPKVYFGSVLPEHTGGLQNSFGFLDDFTLNVNIDYQIGGKFVSLSNMWGSFSGLTARTAVANDKGNPVRDAVADGGGVKVTGVDAANKPVEFYVEAQDYYHQFWGNKVFDPFVYDLTFVKLREVSLGYNIPVKKLKMNKFLQSANFSLVAKSPLLIYATTKDFDPSEIDAIYGETGQLPGTRGFGFNLKLVF